VEEAMGGETTAKQIVEQLSDVATVEGAELAAHLP
jgi:hypothetical protein